MLLHSEIYLFANCSCSNACIMVLPKLTFFLLCAAQGRRSHLNLGGAGAQWWVEVEFFFVDFCSGVCGNLSAGVFSGMALEIFVEITNFVKTRKKNPSQLARNGHPLTTHLPSNYTAALIRLTYDCSFRKS